MNGIAPSPALPVYLITHEFYPVRGGIATFTEEIAKASASLGYDVEVWAQSAPPDIEKTWPFRLRRLPLKGTHGLLCQLRLARELVANRRRLRHATVYMPEPGPMLTMMLLQFFHAFRPKRLVLTFHGSEILKFARSPFRRWLGRQLIRRATRISTLSTYTQELLLTHFPEAATTSPTIYADLEVQFAGQTAQYKHLAFQRVTQGNQVQISGTIPATCSDFKIDRPSFLTVPIKNEIPVRIEMTWHPM